MLRQRSTTTLACSLVVLLMATRASAQPVALPKVHVIGTGGTIAGEQFEPGTLGRYDPKKPVNEIVASVPLLGRYADVSSEQFANVPSPSITPAHWLGLARRINALLAERPDLAGIVVTHGTSRLEETAFFLHLTIRSDRPVVIVGAQRPPTGVSPDGPINLLSAVRVASSPAARNKGALVVMDDRVISARETIKLFPRGGGFEGVEMGVLGTVSEEGVTFFYQPNRLHTHMAEFDLSQVTALPTVGISVSYAGAPGVADSSAKGVVVATTGMSDDEIRYFRGLRAKGVFVAVAFPTGMSDRFSSSEMRARANELADGSGASFTTPLVARHLTPNKARILLMLALTRTTDGAAIQRMFDTY